MKNETFITVQHLKGSIFRWRLSAIAASFLLILALANRAVFKNVGPQGIIARVKIDTYIKNGMFTPNRLKYLEKDFVKGIILDIDSSGGDVVESEKMYNFFRKLAIKKPLVVSVKGMCTSGAYMIAMASDYIIAYNTSLVGSIGVVAESFEITELAKKLGINLTNYKSSPLKNVPNVFEKVTPDVDMIMSQQIDDIYDYFLGVFIERRKVKVTEAQEIANGQTYTGRQALEFGLIDRIGGEDEIREYLKINGFNLDRISIVDYNIYEKPKKGFIKDFVDSSIDGMDIKNFGFKAVLN